jgi:hypothetical protein
MKLLLLFVFLFSSVWDCIAQEGEWTKFEQKCYRLKYTSGEQKAIAYINKKIAKNQLDAKDLANAYFIKAYFYLSYENWGLYSKPFIYSNDTSNFTRGSNFDWLEKALENTQLFVAVADTSQTFQKDWINKLYNPLCNAAVSSWFYRHAPTEKLSAHYYEMNEFECVQVLNRIRLLKEMIASFHPINQFGLQVAETVIKAQLHRLPESELQTIIAAVKDYLVQRSFLTNHEYRLSTNFVDTYGYYSIESHIKNLIEVLMDAKQPEGKQLLNSCGALLLNYSRDDFRVFQEYDQYWTLSSVRYDDQTLGRIDLRDSVDQGKGNSLGIIDLRDSAGYAVKNFPIYYDLSLNYDLPEWDTLSIFDVADDYNYAQTELTNQLILSGKGTAVLKLKFYEYVPEENKTGSFDRQITIQSNRGDKTFHLEAEVIGQAKRTPHSTELMLYDGDNFSPNDYGYYTNGVIGIRAVEKYQTDTLKIYRYPQQSLPVCRIIASENYAASELIYPVEHQTDSVYHFQLLAEYADVYHIVYSNYGQAVKEGWLKKSDFDTSNIALSELVKPLDWDSYYKEGDYILLRNVEQDIFSMSANFSTHFQPTCNTFVYEALETKWGAKMKLSPCQKCTDKPLIESGVGWIDWYRDGHMYVERIKN